MLHAVFALLTLQVLLSIFHIYQSLMLWREVASIADRLGFGVSVPIEQVPQVIQRIDDKLNAMKRKHRVERGLLEELSRLDSETT